MKIIGQVRLDTKEPLLRFTATPVKSVGRVRVSEVARAAFNDNIDEKNLGRVGLSGSGKCCVQRQHR